MRASAPTLHCDAEDGCDRWDIDFYEQSASKVGETRITLRERAPGWKSDDLYDYCPQHAPEHYARWEDR